MSRDQETNGAFDPVVEPFVDFWSQYVKQANDTTREYLDGYGDGSNIKTFQRRWLDAVSKSVDAYLRSPVFLQAMKQNTDAAVKLKRQADDLSAEFARNANIPTATDISGLFERLHSVEEAILNRLGGIEERLQTIEHQIAAGQAAGNP
jgi:hypothetical protein